MMRRLLLPLLLLIGFPAYAQLPPINGVAGPTTAAEFASIAPNLNARHATEDVVDLAIVSNTITIDVAAAGVFRWTNTADITTFAIVNATAGKANTFRFRIISEGSSRQQTWAGTMFWDNGPQPVLTAIAGRSDIGICTSDDGGTSWACGMFGYNFALPPPP